MNDRTKSPVRGTSISEVEVLNISFHGLWLYAFGKEYFLPYDEYPWFTDAKVRDILDVKALHGFHVHWPSLDVDLDTTALQDPDRYPLIYS